MFVIIFMIKNKYAVARIRKRNRKKKNIEINAIHIFTACILAIALFAFTSEAKTIDKPTIITKIAAQTRANFQFPNF